jgi:hypothetical protein
LRVLGRILGRLIAVAFAYVVACVGAGLTIAGSIVVKGFVEGSIGISYQQLTAETMFAVGLTASFAAVYAFAPAVVAMVVAEVFGIRRMAYHVLAGGLVGALAYVASYRLYVGGHAGAEAPVLIGSHFALFVVAGIVGGFVYWGFAGRSAGVLQRAPA